MTIDPLFSNFTPKLELLGLLSKQVLCQGKEAWEPSMPSWVAMDWVLDEAGSRDMASISLREDVAKLEKKHTKQTLLSTTSSLPVQHMSKVFGYLLNVISMNVIFPDPGTCLLGLADFNSRFFVWIQKSCLLRVWDGRLCGCSPGYGIAQHVLKGLLYHCLLPVKALWFLSDSDMSQLMSC